MAVDLNRQKEIDGVVIYIIRMTITALTMAAVAATFVVIG